MVTSGELEQYVITKVQETSVKISGLQVPQFHGNKEIPLVNYKPDKRNISLKRPMYRKILIIAVLFMCHSCFLKAQQIQEVNLKSGIEK